MSQHAQSRKRRTRKAEPSEQVAEVSAGEVGQPTAVASRAVPVPEAVLRSSGIQTADPLGGSPIPGDIVSALRRQAGRGAPLPDQLAGQIGSELGGDVSSARLHTDAEADTLARSVSAVAFTYGSDIYFSAGSFNPGTESGQHLLAHELSHVVQGQHGSAAGAQGTIGMADDPAEHAAEASATRVVSALRRLASTAPVENGPVGNAPVQQGTSGRPAVRRRTSRPGSGRIQVSVRGSAEPTDAAVIRRMLVKVTTERTEDQRTRVITGIKVKGRVPTTVSGGQGDHTVAETLIVEAANGACRYQEYWPAYVKLLSKIDTFARDNTVDRYDAKQIYAEFSNIDEETFRGWDGEDQVARIEDLIDTLIRAANKVANSAFARKEGNTTGGKGDEEKTAIKQIRKVAGDGPASLGVLLNVADYLADLIDYIKWDQALVDFCVRALTLAYEAAPPLSTKQVLLVSLLAEALVRKRFPKQVGGEHDLAQAIYRAMGVPTTEVNLKDWGNDEAQQPSIEAEDLIAPTFEEFLSELGRSQQEPPRPTFQSQPIPQPQVVPTNKLYTPPGTPIVGTNTLQQLPDGWYLILSSAGLTNGATEYDAARLVVHEVADSDIPSEGPSVGAVVQFNSKQHKVVFIGRTAHSTVYYLAQAA